MRGCRLILGFALLVTGCGQGQPSASAADPPRRSSPLRDLREYSPSNEPKSTERWMGQLEGERLKAALTNAGFESRGTNAVTFKLPEAAGGTEWTLILEDRIACTDYTESARESKSCYRLYEPDSETKGLRAFVSEELRAIAEEARPEDRAEYQQLEAFLSRKAADEMASLLAEWSAAGAEGGVLRREAALRLRLALRAHSESQALAGAKDGPLLGAARQRLAKRDFLGALAMFDAYRLHGVARALEIPAQTLNDEEFSLLRQRWGLSSKRVRAREAWRDSWSSNQGFLQISRLDEGRYRVQSREGAASAVLRWLVGIEPDVALGNLENLLLSSRISAATLETALMMAHVAFGLEELAELSEGSGSANFRTTRLYQLAEEEFKKAEQESRPMERREHASHAVLGVMMIEDKAAAPGFTFLQQLRQSSGDPNLPRTNGLLSAAAGAVGKWQARATTLYEEREFERAEWSWQQSQLGNSIIEQAQRVLDGQQALRDAERAGLVDVAAYLYRERDAAAKALKNCLARGAKTRKQPEAAVASGREPCEEERDILGRKRLSCLRLEGMDFDKLRRFGELSTVEALIAAWNYQRIEPVASPVERQARSLGAASTWLSRSRAVIE